MWMPVCERHRGAPPFREPHFWLPLWIDSPYAGILAAKAITALEKLKKSCQRVRRRIFCLKPGHNYRRPAWLAFRAFAEGDRVGSTGFIIAAISVLALAAGGVGFSLYQRKASGETAGFFAPRSRRLAFIERASLDGGRKLAPDSPGRRRAPHPCWRADRSRHRDGDPRGRIRNRRRKGRGCIDPRARSCPVTGPAVRRIAPRRRSLWRRPSLS